MSALVERYANPTAAFDQATAEALVDRITGRLDLADRLDGMNGFLDDVLGPAVAEGGGEASGGTARRSDGVRSVTIEGEGFLDIHHICRGFGVDPPIDAAENGELSVTLGFTEDGIDPVVWGRFAACESLVGESEVLLDGGLNLYLGDNLQWDGFGGSPLLFELAAELIIDGDLAAEPRIDFQICPRSAARCPPGSIELLVESEAGTHLVFFVDVGRTTGGFRASNGTWDCGFDASGATCEQDGAAPVVVAGLTP